MVCDSLLKRRVCWRSRHCSPQPPAPRVRRPAQGAGGFLQSAIFGTSGMRLHANELSFNPPPPRATGSLATMLGVRSFHFRGHRLSQRVTESTATYEVLESGAGAPPLSLVPEGKPAQPLAAGSSVTLPRGRARIVLA